jgi:hypothetical protein
MQVNDKIIVQEGLQTDEIIVTQGTQKLRDNAIVELNTPGYK